MVTTPTTPTHAHLARSSPPAMAAPSQPPAIEPFETLSDDFVAQSTPTLSHAPMPSAPNLARQPLEATVPMLPPSTVPPSTDSLETNNFQKPSGKRVLMEAAPIQELRPAKKQKADGPRPPIIDVFAPIIDNGKKPAIHYAALITLAILRSPQQKLTLSQIYKWITDTFSFYRGDKTGWQNSIRHNLSLNKYFHKQQRPKDDPGKGHYWTVEPGAEYILLKDKPSRKGAAPTAENMPVMSTRLEPSQFQPQLQLPCMAQPMLISQLAPAPPLPEIPSDATIPASDPATIDEGLDRPAERDPFQAFEAYPPLPVAMHSSPPIPRRMEGRYNGTPPSRRHGRSFINDSGYLSSLESSAMRPNQYCNQLLTSEADRPRIRQGRAEVEIARLRGSPYDSPSNGRSFGYAPVPSSPMQPLSGLGAGRMPPPLTPAPKLTAPPMAPPSASPSTNLRLHRQNIQSMVESPFRRVSALLPEGDFVGQQTPGLQVDHLWEFVSDPGHNTTPGFDIHEDASDIPRLYPATPSVAPTGSPMKRSTTRQRHQPRPERWQSSGVLKDVTNTARNLSGQSPASFLKVNQTPNLQFETPSKAFDGLPSSPSKVLVDLQSPSMPLINNENLDVFHGIPDGNEACYMFEFPNFEDDDTQQFDMLAGYKRIGSSGSNNNPTGHGSGS